LDRPIAWSHVVIRNRVILALAIGSAVYSSAPTRASAQSAQAREALLVTPQWLSERVRDANLVILHVGPKPSYDSAHIAGARLVSLAQIAAASGPNELTLQVPAADSLRATLARLGISDDSRIVVVHAAGSVSQATRVVFTLDHAGLGARTVFLDGGLAAWMRAGLPTTAEVPAVREGRLSPLTYQSSVVSADWVRDNVGKPGVVVVDARATGFYDGAQEGGPQNARRRGHIPGATNIPYLSVLAENGDLLPAPQLTEKFRAAGMNQPGDTVAVYCHIGQQATLVVFAARTLGYSVRLFDGSFEEWARRDLPVAVPPRSP
jgi:thiosulfate/3-mercaptopyruvate sulfurtransferase